MSPVKSFNNNVFVTCQNTKRCLDTLEASLLAAVLPPDQLDYDRTIVSLKIWSSCKIHPIFTTYNTQCVLQILRFHISISTFRTNQDFPPNSPPPVCQRFPYPDLPLHLRSPSLASKTQLLWHLKICWYYQHQVIGIINASQWIWMNVFNWTTLTKTI